MTKAMTANHLPETAVPLKETLPIQRPSLQCPFLYSGPSLQRPCPTEALPTEPKAAYAESFDQLSAMKETLNEAKELSVVIISGLKRAHDRQQNKGKNTKGSVTP